jgi:hypothetical protein
MSEDETKISDLAGTPGNTLEPRPEPPAESPAPVGAVQDPVPHSVPPLIRANIAADLREWLLDYADTVRSLERDMTRKGRPSRFRQHVTGAAVDAAAAAAANAISTQVCDMIDEELGKEKTQ